METVSGAPPEPVEVVWTAENKSEFAAFARILYSHLDERAAATAVAWELRAELRRIAANHDAARTEPLPCPTSWPGPSDADRKALELQSGLVVAECGGNGIELLAHELERRPSRAIMASGLTTGGKVSGSQNRLTQPIAT